VSVEDELRLLRDFSTEDVWERAGLLIALAGRLRTLVAGQTGELAATLTKLADELEVPTSDPVEIERRWQHAIGTLESLTAPPVSPHTRKAFWKR
jgi:Ca-activated chloride channel family protein